MSRISSITYVRIMHIGWLWDRVWHGGQSRLGLREYKIDCQLIVAENKTVVYSTCLTDGAWSLVALNCQYDPSFLKGGEIEINIYLLIQKLKIERFWLITVNSYLRAQDPSAPGTWRRRCVWTWPRWWSSRWAASCSSSPWSWPSSSSATACSPPQPRAAAASTAPSRAPPLTISCSMIRHAKIFLWHIKYFYFLFY